MSKPIFIVRFPYNENFNLDHFQQNTQMLEKAFTDYHILTLVENCSEKVEFECYNSPHTEIEFEELKNEVMEMVGNIYKHESKTVTGVSTEQS